MNSLKTICGAALLWCTVFSTSSFAETTQTYRVGWYPLPDAACRADAADIGARFEAATGYQVLSAGCERPFSWKQDVVIQYFAPAEAKLVSTFAEFATAGQGFYATKAACEAGLEQERSLFQDATGLDVVTAFCYPESQDLRQNGFPFIARLDGFGTPEKRPFVFSASLQNKPTTTVQATEAMIEEAVSTMSSLQSPRVKVDFSGTQPRVSVKYYDTRRRALVLNSEVSFESLAACQARQAETDRQIVDFGIEGLRSFCARKSFSNSASHTYFGLLTGAFKVERVPGSYNTRAECEAAAPVIAQRYAAANGSSKVQSFCTFDRQDVFADEAFYIRLFLAI